MDISLRSGICVLVVALLSVVWVMVSEYINARKKAKKDEQSRRCIYDERRKRNIMREAEMWHDIYSISDYLK